MGAAESVTSGPVERNLALSGSSVPVDRAEGVRAWNPLLRIGFRFAFCYYAIWILMNGNASIWGVVPKIGDRLENWAWKPLALLAEVVGQHFFSLTGTQAHWGMRASGDTALDWIVTGIYVAIACAGALVWTILDRRRRAYPTLLAWVRFGLRLALGIAMLEYGFAKVFPLQMPTPSLAVLSEPVGQMAPMTLVWTMIGSSPAYEIVCGLAEVAAGLLILVRRTALMGALLTAFVVSNVVLYNFCFDVPVKLFSLHLLLAAIFVVLPDAGALLSFFWKHEPAAPTGVWVPPAERVAFRRATVVIEIAFLALVVVQTVQSSAEELRAEGKYRNVHSPLQGAWKVEDADVAQPSAVALVYIEGASDEHSFMASARNGNGDRGRGELDVKAQTLELGGRFIGKHKFHYAVEGTDHMVLTSLPAEKGSPEKAGAEAQPATYRLDRLPVPAQWPLLSRGFHLVNEFPYQR